MTQATFSPDPSYLDTGAGTAAQQSARPRRYADHANGGYDVAATGATAGAPGTWSPAGSIPPATFAGMTGITATPATAWTSGQRMVLGDASEAHWTGTAWAPGRVVLAEGGERKRGASGE